MTHANLDGSRVAEVNTAAGSLATTSGEKISLGVPAWTHALLCAATHYLLLLTIQFENIIMYLPPQTSGWSMLWQIPGMQVEFLLASILLAVWFRALFATRWGIGLVVGSLTIVNSYIIFDQSFYTVTFDHFSCSQIENSIGDIVWVWDSFIAVLDPVFVFNVLIVIVSNLLIIMHFSRNQTSVDYLRFTNLMYGTTHYGKILAGVVAMAALSGWFSNSVNRFHLAQHPVSVLITGCLDNPTVPNIPNSEARNILSTAGINIPIPDATPAVAPLSVTRIPKKPLNIVLIVLESIGSKQLLYNGKPDPVITPFLAWLSEHGVVYDAMYASYPATVVSNVAISTGGASLTWSPVDSLRYAYMGKTLAGELNNNGFATGLFSSADLEFGNLGDFFRGIGFDHVFDYGKQQRGFRHVTELNSWGGDDMAVLTRAKMWAQQQSDNGLPFYLRVQTNIAHHPYNIPVALNPAVTHSNPGKQKYLNAVHHLDTLLAKFYAQLHNADLTENTVFAVTGDHGESFGEWHSTNFLHRNFLYDENIRSFLILANRRLYPNPSRISVPVSHGDIMPTLLAVNGLHPPSGIWGRNILTGNTHPGIQFFHKNNHPESWGLRAGRWKYISTFSGDQVELFDLQIDPDEQNNLAQSDPQRTAEYQQLLTAWYVAQNNEFVSRLKGWKPIDATDYKPEDFRKQGPTALKAGYMLLTNNGEEFVESRRMNPDEALFVWTKWISYRQSQQVEFRLTSPTGIHYRYPQRIGPDDITTRIEMPVPRPREEGVWRLQLSVDDAPVLSSTFQLSQTIPLRNTARIPVRSEMLHAVVFHTDTNKRHIFQPGSTLKTNETLHLDVQWPRVAMRRIVVFKWRGPKGQLQQYQVHVKPNQTNSEVIHNGPYPMQPGTWWLTLWERGRQIASKLIRIGDPISDPQADMILVRDDIRESSKGISVKSAVNQSMHQYEQTKSVHLN